MVWPTDNSGHNSGWQNFSYNTPSFVGSSSNSSTHQSNPATTGSGSPSSPQEPNAARRAADRARAQMMTMQTQFASHHAADLHALAVQDANPPPLTSAQQHLETLIMYGDIHPLPEDLQEAENNAEEFRLYRAVPLLPLNQMSPAEIRAAVLIEYPGSADESDAQLRHYAEGMNYTTEGNNKGKEEWYRLGAHVNIAHATLNEMDISLTDNMELEELVLHAFQNNRINTKTCEAYIEALKEKRGLFSYEYDE